VQDNTLFTFLQLLAMLRSTGSEIFVRCERCLTVPEGHRQIIDSTITRKEPKTAIHKTGSSHITLLRDSFA
jgi:hypothetical protein